MFDGVVGREGLFLVNILVIWGVNFWFILIKSRFCKKKNNIKMNNFYNFWWYVIKLILNLFR